MASQVPQLSQGPSNGVPEGNPRSSTMLLPEHRSNTNAADAGRNTDGIHRIQVMRKNPSWAQKAVIRCISFYRRRISPNTPPSCKYYPTCSTYALTAVKRFGAFRGSVLALLRLARCRPWSNGGIDDVPQKFSVFYRFTWSKAHEEPRVVPLAGTDSYDDDSSPHVHV